MSNLTDLTRLITTVLLPFLLIACAEEKKPRPIIKLSQELQSAYDRSCKTCHEVEATHSPQTGDVSAWDDILEQDMALVLERAINGYQGMPPGGQCFECSPEDLKTLILFMAQPKSQQN